MVRCLMYKFLVLVSTIIIGTSCSLVKKVAISSSGSIMQDGSGQMNHEGNWEFFKSAAPANLKMLEGFWYAQQSNTQLLSLLIKGYGGFAFGVHETLALEDQLADVEESKDKQYAIWHYTKAFDYGVKFFKEKGISYKQLSDKTASVSLYSLLDKKLNKEDKIAAFYFAQSWGGLINLQRTNVALMSNLGAVKAIIDWVCRDELDFELGSCDLFYAVYEAGRPAMLGGNLNKGKKIFLNSIKKYPNNLLARVSYIQYYIIPTMDEVLYAKEAEFLKKEFKYWEKSLNLGTRNKLNNKYVKNSKFNLFNSIAKKRFEIIEKYKNEIF